MLLVNVWICLMIIGVVRQGKIWVRVKWIPFLMFFFCLKNKIVRSSDSLQIFRRALLWLHLFSTQRRGHLRKKWVF